uniref:Uncharacterized protein n=1 Tax=Brassica oleracea var. oleracea TaxID=109376 RepID=A0A0D3BNA6_BRAOL
MAHPTMPAPVPPSMAPLMAADIHPYLMVPPSAPYSQWGVDGCLASDVTDTIKGYFSMAHPNWSKTPHYVRKTWFKIYAVSFY